MLRRNLDTAQGLVKGALGTVFAISNDYIQQNSAACHMTDPAATCI